MGVCLCKDKVELDYTNNDDGPDVYTLIRTSNEGENGCNMNNNNNQRRVDELVKETLDVISTIVDDEPETPNSMLLLHDITDRPKGWLCLVRSLIRVIPIDHAMGPSVITLLLDDSPLPSKESVEQVAQMITETNTTIPHERNLCVILGCLAEKLAGPCSIAILTDTTLSYLLKNISSNETPKDVKLFSLIALEKFAQTAENKSTIKRKLLSYPEHPLLHLENHSNDIDDYTLRQIGFCAKWSLDNYFLVDNRKYSYETVDVEKINVMLNTKDVSEYLKISADGLEARCDSYSFESVRSTISVITGAWYYECLIITSGVMQIGWAQKESHFLSSDGYGIGDDSYSVSFDGCRKLIWHNAKSTPINLPRWKPGSICGCYIDLDAKEVIFSLDGRESFVFKEVFNDKSNDLGFFPAASYMSFQQCRFNFGSEPFIYPPNRPFNIFNKNAVLSPQDKIVLPRHLYLEELRKLSVTDDSCSLCFDSLATIQLLPCNHTGFCNNCTKLLSNCPICRADIVNTIETTINQEQQSNGQAS
ncbi:RING finger and SPRY domain-containing protein 1-like isoform X2 [Chironomus tepperi]|uniref:RING finger and SPRY domain-containing protein 1-like isoform X2 n=1 Tax=Chironomus tepperi TaxID=113505 RepID=UPI00391FAC98